MIIVEDDKAHFGSNDASTTARSAELIHVRIDLPNVARVSSQRCFDFQYQVQDPPAACNLIVRISQRTDRINRSIDCVQDP